MLQRFNKFLGNVKQDNSLETSKKQLQLQQSESEIIQTDYNIRRSFTESKYVIDSAEILSGSKDFKKLKDTDDLQTSSLLTEFLLVDSKKSLNNIQFFTPQKWDQFLKGQLEHTPEDLRVNIIIGDIELNLYHQILLLFIKEPQIDEKNCGSIFVIRKKIQLKNIHCSENRTSSSIQIELLKTSTLNKQVQIVIELFQTLFLNKYYFFVFIYEKQITKNALHEILLAYSHYDSEVGYTQGMNFLVANLLMGIDKYFKPDDSVYDSFEVIDPDSQFLRNRMVFRIFSYIMIEQGWRGNFLDGFLKLQAGLQQIYKELQEKHYDLYIHLKGFDLGLNIYFQQLYLSLLMMNSPPQFTVLILDLVISEGTQIVKTILLAMLKFFKDKLIKMRPDQIIQFINTRMTSEFFENLQISKKDRKLFLQNLESLNLLWIEEKKYQIQQQPQRENSPLKVVLYKGYDDKMGKISKKILNYFTKND